MDEESLKASIGTYKSQLQQVDAALQAAGTKDNDDLVKLQTDLGELIQLTEESLLSYMKSTLLAKLESNTGSDHGLFHSMRPAQANAWRPKRSRLTHGTSRSSPPAEHRPRLGAYWCSSAARYSGVPP
ncbi:hypothetical protein LSAT2_017212 [Lamellibrachia satsuma]|nr:hypothetical protein LSAT2_017212 [Lamellibrachia satsuma]